MIEARGPVYFLVYETRRGLKRREIKISPGKIDPRREAIRRLPLLVKRIRRKDKGARDFGIEEVCIFKNGVNL
jgi:hypothetical protein